MLAGRGGGKERLRLVVAEATRLLALVFVVLNIAKVVLGRFRHIFRVRVQLAPKRTKAWDVVVNASRGCRRRRRRRWRRRRLPLAQIAGFLASLLLLIPVTVALLLLALFVR